MATFFIGVYLYGQESLVINGKRNQAGLVAEEGLDIVRNIRDAGFTNLIDGTYGLATSSGQWVFSGSSDTVNGFTRAVTISTVDADHKQISANVTWQQSRQRSGSLTLQSYLTNWTRVGVGDWSTTTIESGLDLGTTVTAIKVVVSGNYAYVIANTAGNDFFIIDITDILNPVLLGQLALTGTPSDIAVSGNYAYVTTNSGTAELQTINITNKSAPSAATFNMLGTNAALSISLSGNYAYITKALSGTASNYEFNIISLTNPGAPATVTGGYLNLTSAPTDAVVSGNYAYLSSTDNAGEFRVINVTNPAAPTLIANLVNLGGNADASSVAVYGNTAYVSRLADANIYPINITTPTAPVSMTPASFAVGGNPTQMVLFNSGKYLAVTNANTAGELRLFDVTTPATPTTLTTNNIPGTTFTPAGMDYSPVYDRLVLAGPRVALNGNHQLIIVSPR